MGQKESKRKGGVEAAPAKGIKVVALMLEV